MIAKYSNLCRICKVRIPAETDVHYDGKAIAHWECVENEPPSPDAFRQAGELGFVKHGDPIPFAEWKGWEGKKASQGMLGI